RRGDQHHCNVGQYNVSGEVANPGQRCHAAFSSRLAARPPTIRKTSSTRNEIDSSTMEMAQAPVRSSFSINARIHCEETSVLPGTAPPIVTTEPNSPMARENDMPAPDNSAGSSDGSTIEVKTFGPVAPSADAASSTSRSRASNTGCTARTTYGNVTNANAMATPGGV